MNAVCFWIEPITMRRRSLRRYVYSEASKCPAPGLGYHNAEFHLGDFDSSFDTEYSDDETRKIPHNFPSWPAQCICGYRFVDSDSWQVRDERLYRRADNGELVTRDDKIPGMMYDATWHHGIEGWCGPDGKALHVVLPNGQTWAIDSRCSNCTMPDDNVHKCWCAPGFLLF